jgi:hypothetical protein
MINRRQFITTVTAAGAMVGVGPNHLFDLKGQTSAPQLPKGKAGIVVAVEGNTIYATNSVGPVTVKVGATTRIWKGTSDAGISAIVPGDDILMRGVTDTVGNFVPSEIWVNLASVEGVVHTVNGNAVDISPFRVERVGQITRVRITDRTATTANIKIDIQPGRHVHVIGLAIPDGTIEATKLTVYINGQPAGSKATRFIDPYTGNIIER